MPLEGAAVAPLDVESAMIEAKAMKATDLDILRSIPDPVAWVTRSGHEMRGDGSMSQELFDPTAPFRVASAGVANGTIECVGQLVSQALSTGQVQSGVLPIDDSPNSGRVELRVVPRDKDLVLCVMRDVTDRHRTERALGEQVAFEALVAAISTRLMSCAGEKLDERIEAGLGEIAIFFDADEAFISELSVDGSSLRISHNWERYPQRASRVRGQRVEIAGFGWLGPSFERSGQVYARGRGAMPGAATRQALVHPDDEGALWVRLGFGGELVGLLGLTWREHEPPPSDDVLGLVRFGADAFLGALKRRSVSLLAEGQAEVFELIARGSPVSSALCAARRLLERHVLGATVVIATVEDSGGLSLVVDPSRQLDAELESWFSELTPGLANPFMRAVATGESVLIADIGADARFGVQALPDSRFASAAVLAVRSPRSGRTLAVIGVLGAEAGVPATRASVQDSVVALVTVAVERHDDQRRLAFQATHDSLTGVGNRAALMERLGLALERSKRVGSLVGVLFCDLDNFKDVNDRYGHDCGDRLLIEVATRIGRAIRPADTVCRTGGDEFVVVCEDLIDAEQCDVIAERVRAAVESTPIELGEIRVPIGISVGVAVADPQLDDSGRLMRSADLAMYALKQRRSAVRAGEADSSQRPQEQIHIDLVGIETRAKLLEDSHRSRRVGSTPHGRDPLGSQVLAAMNNDTLELAYQPIIGRDGSLSGVEALVRWAVGDSEILRTERILAAAAAEGHSSRLTRWVLNRALREQAKWSAPSTQRTVPLHINLSRSDLLEPDLGGELSRVLAERNLDMAALVLEVKEDHLTHSDEARGVQTLSRCGFSVLVEGAGQGGLPIDVLARSQIAGIKLGTSLVGRIKEGDVLGVEAARALVLMGHGIGWRTIAMGVETAHQRSVLFGFGVDAIQGRNCAMPMSSKELGGWLSARVTS